MVLKKLILLIICLSTICVANGKRGYTINSAFYIPAEVPEFGIIGCEIDVLKNINVQLSFGAGISFDLIVNGLPGVMLRISPKVDYKLLNQITKNIFYINTSMGIAYSFITINNKSETEHLSGIGGSFDFIPTFNIGKTFSLGIGSWNNLVFHSKSNITRKRTSTYTKFGFQLGFKI